MKEGAELVPAPKMGRLGIYSQAIADKVLGYVRKGLTYDRAAEAVGVSPRTIESWRDRKPDFAVALKKARRDLESECLDTIRQAGEKSWQARAWIAERVFGYAQPSARVEVAGAIAHGATPQLAQMLAGLNIAPPKQGNGLGMIEAEVVETKQLPSSVRQQQKEKTRKVRKYSKRPTPPRAPAIPPPTPATHIPPLSIPAKNKKASNATTSTTNTEGQEGAQQAA